MTTAPPPDDAPRYPGGDLTFYGVTGSLYAEGGFVVFGHGRRALAAANAIGRYEDGCCWRAPHGTYRPEVQQVWSAFHETCGCTLEEHAAGHPTGVGTEEWPECDCEFPGLPPCEDEFNFVTQTSATEKPGWLPVVQVTW